MQVKVAPDEGAVAAGTRLTAAVDGSVRALQTRTVEGMVVAEGAPVIGVALEAAKDGAHRRFGRCNRHTVLIPSAD